MQQTESREIGCTAVNFLSSLSQGKEIGVRTGNHTDQASVSSNEPWNMFTVFLAREAHLRIRVQSYISIYLFI